MKHLCQIPMVFAIITLLVVMATVANVQSEPVLIVTPTPAPTPTPTPLTPTPTPTSNIALDYSQVSINEGAETTTVVLAVKATYNFGESVTLHYQDFLLNIFRPRGGVPSGADMMLHTADASPAETRSVTLSHDNREANLRLTFSFTTMQSGFEGPIKYSSYQLVYNEDLATATPEPSPSVPELTPLMVLPLFAAVLAIAVFLKNKKALPNPS